MASFQQVILVGNMGSDPEMRYTPQGIAVCNARIAVNEVWGKGDERKEKTTWFKITVWRDRAETFAKYVKKGHQIMLIGTVEAKAYTDKNGEIQASLELTVNDFKFLERKSDGEGEGDKYSGAPRRSGDKGHNSEEAHGYEVDMEDIPF